MTSLYTGWHAEGGESPPSATSEEQTEQKYVKTWIFIGGMVA